MGCLLDGDLCVMPEFSVAVASHPQGYEGLPYCGVGNGCGAGGVSQACAKPLISVSLLDDPEK